MFILDEILRTRLEVLTKLVPLYVGTAAIALAVLLPNPLRLSTRRQRSPMLVRPIPPSPRARDSAGRRTLLVGVGALAIGSAVGLATAWALSDVVDAVGVTFTPIIRMWFALAGGGVALGVVRLRRGGGRRRLLAGLLIPASLLAGAFGVNVDVAAYPTLNALFHRDSIRALPQLMVPASLSSVHDWRAVGALRNHGVLGTVSIPAPRSHFRARPAVVYLPPAALTADPPRLPVILSLSGQPGWPTDVFVNGGLPGVLDRYASRHHGVAPIVIAADQLGLPGNNPMCLDSGLGRVDTFLTQDVPAWAGTHLPATSHGWGIEGFSEGGTCAMQLLAGDRTLFDAALAIAPEAAPEDRGVANTVHEAFGGSMARYLAATPVGLLHRLGPFPEDLAVIGWGTDDEEYGADARVLIRAAQGAGMHVAAEPAVDSAHDWNTVTSVLQRGIPKVTAHLLAAEDR